MRSYLQACLLAAVVAAPFALSGCGSTGAAREGLIRENLGTSSRNVVVNETLEALTIRYGYVMLRTVVDTEDLLFETDWKREPALPDEREQGYTNARTKITVRARPRNRSGSGAQNLAVTFLAETQVLPFGNDIWVSAEPTEDREEYIDTISSYLRRTYQTTLR